MRGLQEVSARCGLLPKSYLIFHNSLTEPDDDFSATGRVSKTCQRSIGGQFVAVKTITPDCIDNFNAFKHVRLPPLQRVTRYLLSKPFSISALPETVHQFGHLEATKTPECGQLPRFRLRFSPFLPRISLDVQREPLRLSTQSPRCR